METGFVVYCHAVPLGLELPGIPALEPMRTAAFFRDTQPWFSDYLGISEPVWGDINPDMHPPQDHMLR